MEGLNSVVNNIVAVGVVSSFNEQNGTVRVTFDDKSNSVSYDMPVVIPQSLKNKDYYLPDVGEHVLCLFLGNGQEQGFVLGSFYSKADAPPIQKQNKRHTLFSDGTFFEYDRDSNTLTVDCVGHMNLKFKGNVNIDVDGSINMSSQGTTTINGVTSVNVISSNTVNNSAPTVNVLGDAVATVQAPKVNILAVDLTITGG